jgi:hypothetical protein
MNRIEDFKSITITNKKIYITIINITVLNKILRLSLDLKIIGNFFFFLLI